MKHILSATLLATAVLVANFSLANSNTQEVSKASASQVHTKLRLNQASVEQLTAVPGLGSVKAQAIVEHITQNGAIKSEAELTKVKGIGEKLAARVAQYVSFE